MKAIKRIGVVFALAIVTVASATGLEAGCLSAYNNYLIVCEEYTSGFREIGCKTDAWVQYYGCIARSATA